MLDRPADILGQDVEGTDDFRGELADIERLVEENRSDFRAFEQVVDIARQLQQFRYFILVLGIDCVQLFVNRVQFLIC